MILEIIIYDNITRKLHPSVSNPESQWRSSFLCSVFNSSPCVIISYYTIIIEETCTTVHYYSNLPQISTTAAHGDLLSGARTVFTFALSHICSAT